MTPPIPSDKVGQVDAWLRSVLWEATLPAAAISSYKLWPTDFEIHRLKGILLHEDGSSRIIQAVRDVFEIRDPKNDSLSTTQCKIVLIGRGLGPNVDPWKESFESFIATQ